MPRKVVSPAGAVLFALAVLLSPSLSAQETKPDQTPEVRPETEAEKQERAGRRKCAALICGTLHNKTPSTGEVSCNVQKTWRKEALTKILSRVKVSWPWGDTRCASQIKLDRAILIKAVQDPAFEAQFETYDIRCQIDAANEKKPDEKYDVTAQIKPKVTFKEGKAVKARLNWGKVEAPTLAKSVLWPITAADNTLGLLQGLVVEDINEFMTTKCMEVKDVWQSK